MKLFNLFTIFTLLSLPLLGQVNDSTFNDLDTLDFKTTNAFQIQHDNYETFNNSFITGNSYSVIRNQSNNQLTVDGILINPYFSNNTLYSEFLGKMHLLSYDIQDANLNTLENEGQIVTGKFNNAIDFRTHDIQLGNSKAKYEINNFTSLAYQNIDTLGFSSIFNFKAEKSYDKFGYRVSLNNGYQDDYIIDNGIQRFGGNLKLKHQLTKKILLNGFLDYTNLKDMNRSIGSNMNSKRLLSYLEADVSISNTLSLKSKYGINHVTDNAYRRINQAESIINDNYSISSDFSYNRLILMLVYNSTKLQKTTIYSMFLLALNTIKLSILIISEKISTTIQEKSMNTSQQKAPLKKLKMYSIQKFGSREIFLLLVI